jgi:hypothetical protein
MAPAPSYREDLLEIAVTCGTQVTALMTFSNPGKAPAAPYTTTAPRGAVSVKP